MLLGRACREVAGIVAESLDEAADAGRVLVREVIAECFAEDFVDPLLAEGSVGNSLSATGSVAQRFAP